MSRKDLPPDQADRVRAALKKIVVEEYGGKQTRAAGPLKIKQTMISHVLLGGGVGYPTARKVVDYLHADFDDLILGRKTARFAGLEGYRDAERAARERLGVMVLPETFDTVARWTVVEAPEGPPSEWLEELLLTWDRIVRRRRNKGGGSATGNQKGKG